MQTDFTVFREHVAEACRGRKRTPDPLCAAAMDLHFAGVRALDVYRLAKIADDLDVSVDWLLGRSDIMELPKAKKKNRPARRKPALTAPEPRRAQAAQTPGPDADRSSFPRYSWRKAENEKEDKSCQR